MMGIRRKLESLKKIHYGSKRWSRKAKDGFSSHQHTEKSVKIHKVEQVVIYQKKFDNLANLKMGK